MRLLVTGAAGMLGADVVAVAGSRGHECFGLSRAELDVTDEHAVEAAIAALAPEAIVNCAAWTDVEGAEGLEQEALAVNGTLTIASPASPTRSLFTSDFIELLLSGRCRRTYAL